MLASSSGDHMTLWLITIIGRFLHQSQLFNKMYVVSHQVPPGTQFTKILSSSVKLCIAIKHSQLSCDPAIESINSACAMVLGRL